MHCSEHAVHVWTSVGWRDTGEGKELQDSELSLPDERQHSLGHSPPEVDTISLAPPLI